MIGCVSGNSFHLGQSISIIVNVVKLITSLCIIATVLLTVRPLCMICAVNCDHAEQNLAQCGQGHLIKILTAVV